jgi:hypothetical protein
VQFENKDLQFQAKDGIQKAVVELFGRITSVTGRRGDFFEETITVDSATNSSIYQKSLPLAPGRYRLNLVIKDMVGGAMNCYSLALTVPRIEPGKLSASTLILADLLEKTPPRGIGTGPLVIGATKVRPDCRPSSGATRRWAST